jgi:hypothetical protein
MIEKNIQLEIRSENAKNKEDRNTLQQDMNEVKLLLYRSLLFIFT